jgi:hypothetical protein
MECKCVDWIGLGQWFPKCGARPLGGGAQEVLNYFIHKK